MIVYYKGADIDIEFAMFKDANMSEPLKFQLSELVVDVALYTNMTKHIIKACSELGSELIVKQTSESTMLVTIPRTQTKLLAPGVITIEVGIMHKATNKRDIARKESIYIEESVIGKG